MIGRVYYGEPALGLRHDVILRSALPASPASEVEKSAPSVRTLTPGAGSWEWFLQHAQPETQRRRVSTYSHLIPSFASVLRRVVKSLSYLNTAP